MSQVKEPQKIPSGTWGNARGIVRHIIVKLLKTKDKVKILKAAREKKKHTQKNKAKNDSRLLNRKNLRQKKIE